MAGGGVLGPIDGCSGVQVPTSRRSRGGSGDWQAIGFSGWLSKLGGNREHRHRTCCDEVDSEGFKLQQAFGLAETDITACPEKRGTGSSLVVSRSADHVPGKPYRCYTKSEDLSSPTRPVLTYASSSIRSGSSG